MKARQEFFAPLARNYGFDVAAAARAGGALLLGIVATGCGSAGPGSTTEKTGAVSQAALFDNQTREAFAWVQANGTTTSNYSYTDQGFAVSATNNSTGFYTVTIPDAAVSGDGGNVQIVAYGNDNDRCTVVGWGGSGTDVIVSVHCHTPSGADANSAFVMRFSRSPAYDAYVWANQPTASSYTPAGAWSYNYATNQPNTIARLGVGAYRVYMPVQESSGGTVLVTAYGQTTNYCKVLTWNPSGTDEYVTVLCFNTAGAPADTLFSLYYTPGLTWAGNRGAWAWANDQTSFSYTPSTAYSYDSGESGLLGPQETQNCTNGSQGLTAADRYGTGTYFLHHSLMDPVHSAVHVTAYGSDSNYCKVQRWVTDGDGVGVWTLCFNASGAAADDRYVEVYATADNICSQ